MSSPEWLQIGSIVAAHGIQGEVKIWPETDFPDRLTRGVRRLVSPQGDVRSVTILSGRPHKNSFLLRLEGVITRNQAEALVGGQLFIPASERPSLAAEEFLVVDLIGLEVRRADTAQAIGTVKDILRISQDLLVVALADQEVMIPFVPALVPQVNLAEGWLSVTPIAGLLDPTQAEAGDREDVEGTLEKMG